MSGVATLMAVALALVFAVAGGLKFVAPDRTSDEFERLQLPRPALLARVVPAVELTLAVVLGLRPALGGPIAVLLLLAFTVVLVRTIRAGLDVSCGCLGSLDRRPVSWDAVARNGALLTMALLVSMDASPSLRQPDLASALVVIGFAVIASVGVQLLALRQVTGQIWSVQPAGEIGRAPRADRRSPAPPETEPDRPTPTTSMRSRHG